MEWQLLSPLSPDDRAEVLAAAVSRRFAKGEVVFHEGDPGESLLLVRSGRLAVRVSTTGGDTATLSVLSPGDAFGELALLRESHERTATVVALEPAETVSLRRADFEALRRRNPGVEQLLVQILAKRVDDLSQALLEALYVGVDRRVVRRLVDLAGMAGTTRPTVNQILQRLSASGALVLGRGRIELRDVAALRRRTGRPAAQERLS